MENVNQNVNEGNFDEEFYFAASMGDADTIKDIFQSGDFGSVNTRNAAGNTPLIIACAWGLDQENVAVFRFSDVIQLLVDNGSDINATNHRGQSALYMAASWGHWDVVQYLLEHGASATDAIVDVASFTEPRRALNRGSRMGYYNHEILAKHHGYKMAKLVMEDLKAIGQFGDILTNLDEDYNRIVAYTAEDSLMDIPDDVMNLIVYYNHFATVVLLVQDMEPDTPLMETDLFLDSVRFLGEQRRRFDNLQQE